MEDKKYDWEKLNPMHLGRYSEYFAKMEFAMLSFDIYEPEMDDKGVDFVVHKRRNKFYEIQVKSVVEGKYIFMRQDKFAPDENLYVMLVLFIKGRPPEPYLIPSNEWKNKDKLLLSRNYPEKKSKPEQGINIPKKNMLKLSEYKFDRIAKTL